MLVRLHAIIVLLVSAATVTNGQGVNPGAADTDPLKVKIVPPAPEAASLGKFIDMPVSLYSGTPTIDYPIFSLTSYELQLPISLSYHASGIKAEEIPSWVGSGWALNAGGVVSRTVRGIQDEAPYRGFLATAIAGDPNVAKFFTSEGNLDLSYLTSHVNVPGYGGACESFCDDDYVNIYMASKGIYDFEPDAFFYSLPNGESGQFQFERNMAVKQIPKRSNTIEHFSTSGGIMFDRWVVTALNGDKYYFEDKDSTDSYNNCDVGTNTQYNGTCDAYNIPEAPPVASSWKLSKIVSASGNDTIWFEYEPDIMTYTSSWSSTEYNLVGGTNLRGSESSQPSGCQSNITATEQRIKKITTRSGYEVEFVPEPLSFRYDIYGARSLKEIIIRYKHQEIKRYKFSHTGLTNMLTSVAECFNAGAKCLPSSTFEYYPGVSVLDRESKNIDHWGYYNGASNTSLIPGMIYDDRLYSGADREPNLEYARTNTIKSITHPTKGKTEYEFELNDYSNLPSNQYLDQSVVSKDLLAEASFTITSSVSQIYSVTSSFTLEANSELVYVYILPDVGGNLSTDCHGTVTGTGYSKHMYDASNTNPLLEDVPAGTYQFTAYFKPSSFSWTTENPLANQPFQIKIYKVNRLSSLISENRLKGGGLRIKEIRKYDENGNMVLNKRFTYSKNGKSTGKLMSYPTYASFTTLNNGYMHETAGCVITQTGTYLVRTTNTTIPLGISKGVHVGYSEVTEHYGTLQKPEGYKLYFFKNLVDQTNGPNAPTTSFGYKNGLVLKEQVFNSSNTLIQETTNSYDSLGYQVVGRSFRIRDVTNNACTYCGNRLFDVQYYNSATEKMELRSTLTKSWDSNGNVSEMLSKFSYTLFDQISVKQDFVKGTATPLYTSHKYHGTNHTSLQERYSFYLQPGDTALMKFQPKFFVSGIRYVYNSYIKPDTVFLLDESENASDFPSYSPRLIYSQYNNQGKPVAYRLTDNITTTIVWDANSEYPIAEIKNATPSQVFYTSFEDVPGNNISIARTGKKGHKGIYQFNLPSSGTFTVTYWRRPETGVWDDWELVTETKSSSPVTIGGTNIIVDELRVFPAGAEVTSFAYQEGVGVISITDQNNNTTYYDYDAFQKLRLIKDDKLDILKTFNYHYKQ